MPAVGQGEGKLRSRPATAGDLAIRSRYFRSKVSLLSGSHPQNITFATPMSCPILNFAKGSMDWGFNNQLLLLSRGAISKEEIFWMLMEDRPEAEKIEYLHSRALEPSTVFVFHAEPHAIFAEPRALFHTMLSRYNLVARNVRTFRHRRGDPIYLVQKVETKLQ